MKTAWEGLGSDLSSILGQVSSPLSAVFNLFLLKKEKELMQGHWLVLIPMDPLKGTRRLTRSTFIEEETGCKSQHDLPKGLRT